MGFLRAEFGCTRYYEYQVGVGPEEAVRRAVAFWHALDCEVADYNMDSRLRELGYTGTEVSGGGGSDAVFKNDLLDLLPFGIVLLFSRRIRLSNPAHFQVGIAAPLDGPDANRTTLVCFHATWVFDDRAFVTPKEYTELQMIALGEELARQGVLLEKPRRFTQRTLPRDNPLRVFQWNRIRRAAIDGS